jgi:hypothetical protein
VVSRPLVAQLCGLLACADNRRKFGMQMDSYVANPTLNIGERVQGQNEVDEKKRERFPAF